MRFVFGFPVGCDVELLGVLPTRGMKIFRGIFSDEWGRAEVSAAWGDVHTVDGGVRCLTSRRRIL